MKAYHATIMVVDDDPSDLMLIERAFRAIGVKDPIHTINGGLEAIAHMMGEGKYADRSVYAYPTFMPNSDRVCGRRCSRGYLPELGGRNSLSWSFRFRRFR